MDSARMAWEKRRNGRRFYYRSVRVNGRVKKVYFGSGPRAIAAAEEDRKKRLDRSRRRREVEERHQRVLEVEAAVSDYEIHCQEIVEDALRGAGQHLHRGSWRTRRITRT